MADDIDCEKKVAWIERVKSEGSVPLLDSESCSAGNNGWATPPGDKFMVRGPEYFSPAKAKIPAGDYLLKPLGFDWIKSSAKKIEDVLNDPENRVRKAVEKEFSDGDDKPFVWAFNLQVPSKENYSAVAYFTTSEPILEGSLVDRFLRGDDGFRNSRLKLIANVVNGPWIVRKAVGEQAICVIGRALSCKYRATENYLKVDVDIGSSVVASAIVRLAFGYIAALTVDLAFLIESQTESELPEQVLGAVRFSGLNPSSATPVQQIDPCYNKNDNDNNVNGNDNDDSQSSLPTRLWKSIGQGFSHILHHQGNSPSGSISANGTADRRESADGKVNAND